MLRVLNRKAALVFTIALGSLVDAILVPPAHDSEPRRLAVAGAERKSGLEAGWQTESKACQELIRARTEFGKETCKRKHEHDAVITYLVPAKGSVSYVGSDWEKALASLRSLRNLEDHDRAEVRIFLDEEDSFTSSDINELLAAAAPRDVCTVSVRFRVFPSKKFSDSCNPSWAQRRSGNRWGYFHMIRFFFVDLFETDALKGFKYWMRMDTDSYFKEPVSLDPFQRLDHEEETVYLHNRGMRDCGPRGVVDGLAPFMQWYVGYHGLPSLPKSVVLLPGDRRIACILGYYNNFEIGRIAAFQTPPMQSFRDAVQASAGIYSHRWGDALLRRISIELANMTAQPIDPILLHSYVHER